MLPKQNRITKSHDYKRILQTGKKWRTPIFIAFLSKTTTHKTSRIGIITSRKVGKATERNYARRILKEILRPEIGALQSDLEMVFVVLSEINDWEYQDIRNEVLQTLRKLDLYRKN